jgi:hypothetical protein
MIILIWKTTVFHTVMVLVVDIDEGNMMEPNNFKVAHGVNTEYF